LNPTNCEQAVVTITVSPAAIDAVNNTFGPINGYTGATTASVLTNDLLNGVAVIPSQVTLTGVTVPTGFTLNANGTITVAAGIAAGTYTVTYQICEVLNPTNCDQAVVTITVVNDPPIANTDSVSTDEDSPITIFILANDTDVDGNLDTTSVNITQQPSNGTINVDPITGAITYTPNPDFNGIDTLIYEVCDLGTPALCDTAIVIFTVNPINDAPIANADYANTYEDTPVLIGILNNDTDLDGNIDSTTVTVINSPLNGTISIDPVNGAITYTPNPGFFGTDTMIYQICDDGTPLPAQCDTALVVIQVVSCLTIPTFDCDGDGATNEAESAAGTNPSDPCDYAEESVSQTPANEWYDLDCDGDGVTNALELSDGTDLNNPCDVLIASQNVAPSDEWLDSDCDNDGISNGEEIELGNNIFDPCSPNPSLTSCIKDLIVPEAITPDGDGSNDSFVIPGIENYPDNKLIVFNRWGNIVFEKESYSNDWSGTTNVSLVVGNDELPSGTYYYLLDLKTEGMKILKGFVYIQR
jgi:gliding motility-associated-like protein